MNSKKEIVTDKTKPKARRPRRATPVYPAAEKAQAVLAVWTDRMKPSDVMRAMGVSYLALQQWQERAMEGMIQALETRANLADGAALSPRLRSLLRKRQEPAGTEKLKARLERMQEVAPAAGAGSNA